MTLLAGVVSPHAPILVPQIAGDKLSDIARTVEALTVVADRVAKLKPDTLIFISPHSPVFQDAFIIRTEARFQASFAFFERPEITFDVPNDLDTVETILSVCQSRGAPIYPWEDTGGVPGIDWGVTVPYSYLGKGLPIVSISISELDYDEHYQLGMALVDALAATDKRIVFIASADLSHKLSTESPYGFAPGGKTFDDHIVALMQKNEWGRLGRINQDLVAEAGECGLRSLITLGGLLSGYKVETEMLSYEGPFGIGYMVAFASAEPREQAKERFGGVPSEPDV